MYARRGMVESAFEFAEICRKHDYHNFVFSMKASNPLVMVAAYRLLAEEQYKRGWDYPLHLGVTGERAGERVWGARVGFQGSGVLGSVRPGAQGSPFHIYAPFRMPAPLAEAGEGEDGRMKSAIGIGALLMDGLGDTIRVSLTEDPEYEIDPCTRLAKLGEQACKEVGVWWRGWDGWEKED
jgi:(E)-4-hydroxy-3-methylbut-2-enyl-diphosphate synthase